MYVHTVVAQPVSGFTSEKLFIDVFVAWKSNVSFILKTLRFALPTALGCVILCVSSSRHIAMDPI